LPPYPEDKEGWVSLDRAVATQCTRLRSLIRDSKKLIEEKSRFAEDDLGNDLGEALDEEAARLGLEARRLAKNLCRRYQLPSARANYPSRLEDAQKRVIQRRRQRG
jgi:hypothetical protein